MAKGNGQKLSKGSALGFEAQLWTAADKMRGHRAKPPEIPLLGETILHAAKKSTSIGSTDLHQYYDTSNT